MFLKFVGVIAIPLLCTHHYDEQYLKFMTDANGGELGEPVRFEGAWDGGWDKLVPGRWDRWNRERYRMGCVQGKGVNSDM